MSVHIGHGSGKYVPPGHPFQQVKVDLPPVPTVTRRWWQGWFLPILTGINLMLFVWHLVIMSECRQLARNTTTAQGLTAHHKGIGFTENPYSCETAPDMRLWWYEGWRRAELDERKRRAKPDFDRAIADKAQDE